MVPRVTTISTSGLICKLLVHNVIRCKFGYTHDRYYPLRDESPDNKKKI